MDSAKASLKKEIQELIPHSVDDKIVAQLYGILLGDGCISKVGYKYYFVSITGNSTDDKKFFKYVIELLKALTGKTYPIKKKKGKNAIEINFCNKKLFNFLSSLEFPIGKKGPNLKIPSIFKEDRYKFIVQGYFATDGCLVITNNNGISYPRIEFSSISKGLLDQVLAYLIEIGMIGKIYLSKKYSNPNWHPIYRIQCNGNKNLEVFRKKVGFINIKHRDKYYKWKNSAGDGI